MQPSITGVEDLPFYIISIGLHELQPKIDRPNGKEHDQFFYNSCGTGWLILDGVEYHLSEGSAFFIPANMPHCYYPDSDVWDVRWIELDGYALSKLYQKYDMLGGMVFQLQDEAELDRILNKMRQYVILNSDYGTMLAASYLYPFIMEFIHQSRLFDKEVEKADISSRQIKLLEEYIKVHYMHHISMDDLCKVIRVTPQHVCRIFKKNLNLRPMEYIRKVRIDEAKSLLLYSDFKVGEIAERCGFKNKNYFSKLFFESEKIAPLEYRKSVL